MYFKLSKSLWVTAFKSFQLWWIAPLGFYPISSIALEQPVSANVCPFRFDDGTNQINRRAYLWSSEKGLLLFVSIKVISVRCLTCNNFLVCLTRKPRFAYFALFLRHLQTYWHSSPHPAFLSFSHKNKIGSPDIDDPKTFGLKMKILSESAVGVSKRSNFEVHLLLYVFSSRFWGQRTISKDFYCNPQPVVGIYFSGKDPTNFGVCIAQWYMSSIHNPAVPGLALHFLMPNKSIAL